MENNYISLFDLMSMVRRQIEEGLSSYYWVVAEISEIKVNSSGHCYLELIDNQESEKQARARVSAVIWSSKYYLISTYFHSETGQHLQRGLKILVKCKAIFHELYGLSLQIVDIDPIYTVGEVFLHRRQIIEQLKSDGVFEMNRELTAAEVIQRVAVVSSPQAAGFQDFLNELKNSRYKFNVELFEALVQGEVAEGSIISALDKVYQRIDEFDCVVVIRGGGSQHDLSCFDSYGVCANLAQFPLPILTGIGHDKDVSVADMVAYRSFKTPTAVATFLVERASIFSQFIDSAEQRIISCVSNIIRSRREKINIISKDLKINTQRIISDHINILTVIQTKLNYSYSQISGERLRLANIERLIIDRSKHAIENGRFKLDMMESLTKSRSPLQILKLGYSIVRVNGSVVNNVSSLAKNDNIEITMSDGIVDAKVERVKKINRDEKGKNSV